MKTTNFMPTPLQQQIVKQVNSGHPRAFAISNLGEGPILTHRGYHVCLDLVSIDLICGTQHAEISHLTQPPYIFLLAQEIRDQRISLILYQENPDPVLSYNGVGSIEGQIIGCSKPKDGGFSAFAHALFDDQCSEVFAKTPYRNSLLVAEDPELYRHLILCAKTIDRLLRFKKGGEEGGF